LQYDPTEGLERLEKRDTVVNWEVELQEIVDGYLQHTTIGHAVQKDAVQNGWDAKTNAKAKDWKFSFELIEGKNLTLLTMTDEGTHGLTGRVLKRQELMTDLPNEERWGRFENMAFKKRQRPGNVNLGSRGRGKFVFVGASNEKTILYDSLREDGTYRCGLRYVMGIDTKTVAEDEQAGANLLNKKSYGMLSPLRDTGSRIIIVNPNDEIIKYMKSGLLSKFIGTTWREIISKYGAKIVMKISGIEELVEAVPSTFPKSDSVSHSVWIKQSVPIHRSVKGKNMRCKKLHLVYNKGGKIDAEIQGLAIQRSGMKICSHKLTQLPPDIRECIYGFIELEDGWEIPLMQAEGIEHYSLNWSKNPVALLHLFIKDQVETFAKKKLGFGVDVRKVREKNQKEAESRALKAVNKMAKKWGMKFGGGSSEGGGNGSTKEIRMKLFELSFPRVDDLRVDYNEKVENITAVAINDTDQPIKVKITVELVYAGDVTVKNFYSGEISLDQKSRTTVIEKEKMKFTKENFRPGQYSVTTKMVSLMPGNKGDILDKKRKSIYLEEDPPAKGIFEKCEPVVYPDRFKKIMAEHINGTRRGYILQYNSVHPEHKDVIDDKDRLAAYLVRLMITALCSIDVEQEQPKLFQPETLESPDGILKRTNVLVGECMYDYRESS